MLTFEWLLWQWPPPALWPTGPVGWLSLSVHLIVAGGWLWHRRHDGRAMSIQHRLGTVGLALAGSVAALACVIIIPADIVSPPGQPVVPVRPPWALLALLPALLAGGWLGVWPALVVGLATGLARAVFESHQLLTAFEYMWLAGWAAWCMQQDYRGFWVRLVRSPVVAVSIGALGGLWLSLIAIYAGVESSGLAAADYVGTMWLATMPMVLGQALSSGVVAEVVRRVWPGLWVVRTGRQPPPYRAALTNRLLFALVPLFVAGIVMLSVFSIVSAYQASTDLVLSQMSSMAQRSGESVPVFTITGRTLLKDLAEYPRPNHWFALAPDEQSARLFIGMQDLPFFQYIALFDTDNQPAAAWNVQPTDFLAEDMRAAVVDWSDTYSNTGLINPEVRSIYTQIEGEPGIKALVLFITPVFDANNQFQGVLAGAVDLKANPWATQIISLQNMLGGQGQGMVVDENNRILFHPDPAQIGRQPPDISTYSPIQRPNEPTQTFYGRAADGTSHLLLVYTLEGHPWRIVMMLPNQMVLERAVQIGLPTLSWLLVFGVICVVLVIVIARQVTRPAEALALAAQRIAEGQLDQRIEVWSEDEVGRAGQAFELMRVKLRDRLNELGLLLKVSQSVSASLNLEDSLPPILQGALMVTQAAGVRVVLAPPADDPASIEMPALQTVFAAGPKHTAMQPLDFSVLDLARTDGRLVIENLARARAVLDVAPVVGKLHALLALPLKQENRFYGVLWVGYDTPHVFNEAEINFMATLAGQAAVAVANARLFEAAEQGRQRLAAILASTPDAVVVTDRNNHILLLNPAAEAAFEVAGQSALGRPVAEVINHPNLVRLLQEHETGATGEFDITGRTLYASASPIVGAEGHAVGRVCVLRDVTHFKEVDQMKSEFVATVSHDLRAPLTFMRGYATMLPMVGTLTDKQRDFCDKIILGIEQMTKLIDDLLDLGRIEAGVGLARELCRLEDILKAAFETLQSIAAHKNITLTLDFSRPIPVFSGDPTLLRQAIANLVDNAIKYTPSGGTVTVRADFDDDKVYVAVSDTGVGIAPADQVHLFEKFFRVKQRGSTQVKGSGLGLAIVKSIVERHDGRVWMESKLGKGSTFHIDLPRYMGLS